MDLSSLMIKVASPASAFSNASSFQSPHSVESCVSPDDTPLAIPMHSIGGSKKSLYSEHEMSESLGCDLETVLATKSVEYKKVEFEPCSPEELTYIVSKSVDVSRLRRVGRLFPPLLSQSSTNLQLQDLVQCTGKSVLSEDEDEPLSPGSPSLETMSPGSPPEAPKSLSEQLLDSYIDQSVPSLKMSNTVRFDKISVTESNQKTTLLSSKGLTQGRHEWSVEILSADVDLQEIGVVGTSDIERVSVSDDGAIDTAGFQSRALYGCSLGSGQLFYGSINADDTPRCTRDLRPYYNCGWTVGTLITVVLNLERGVVKFMINGRAVRYSMSLEKNKAYYPAICFSGKCKYVLH